MTTTKNNLTIRKQSKRLLDAAKEAEADEAAKGADNAFE